MRKPKTKEQFIKDSILFHGNKYNYGLVNYINNNTNVRIICLIHGEFDQCPRSHLMGRGCPYCSKYKSTFDNFINKANLIHGNKYIYSNVNYIDSVTKVKIICPEHGEFEQKPDGHLNGKGCSLCGGSKKKTTEEFINMSVEIHGNKYDYSLVNYKNTMTKVSIVCPIHGIFKMKPNNHIVKKQCCPKCNISKGEISISNFLKNNKIKFEPHKRFHNCKNILSLSFDFYLPEYNICIEYDGIQHFESIKYWGGDENLELRKLRDSIKNHYCLSNGIKLFRIRYDEDINEKMCVILNGIKKPELVANFSGLN